MNMNHLLHVLRFGDVPCTASSQEMVSVGRLHAGYPTRDDVEQAQLGVKRQNNQLHPIMHPA